ncbi:MAG: VWA domain-containing protein [Anaerolineaceae bacterium]|nr:VWA domain-containing protein [Anaerolineaceae bacterium]MDE0328779.1 VWA domain-containing protein [Anaerolineaceae bacterium]
MDARLIEFIRALRASGLRVSLAESQDAGEALEAVGVAQRERFRAALRSTLVKEARDQPVFDYFFPLFFGSGQPLMSDIPADMTEEQRDVLREALMSLAGDAAALRDLLRQLLEGQRFSESQLQQLGEQSSLAEGESLTQRRWYERRMRRAAGLTELEQLIQELLQMLEAMGMGEEARRQLHEMLQQNVGALNEQLSQHVGSNLAQQMAARGPERPGDLQEVPFNRLRHSEVEALREELQRLAARLRTRAALRQQQYRAGNPDPRRTLRASLRNGGLPLEIRHRQRRRKPALLLLCDLSTSMRHCAGFLLMLVYQLQDQVTRTSSFIFIDDLVEISDHFASREPRDALLRVMRENPPGHYNTDLGRSLTTLCERHADCIDPRTTLIILGDGRNNFNDPRLDLAQHLQRRSHRLFWFNPEPDNTWGSGDSDMTEYARHADGVYPVRTLRELAGAVEEILAAR